MTPENAVFARAVPVLRMFDVPAARAFYVNYLGFAVDWEHRFAADMPLYMAVSRGGLTFHLSEHHGDATPGSTVFVPMEGLDALHAELVGKDYRFARPEIDTVDWGRQMQIHDPSGNRLRFTEQQRLG